MGLLDFLGVAGAPFTGGASLALAGLSAAKKVADSKRAQSAYNTNQNLNAVKAATSPWLKIAPTDMAAPEGALSAGIGGALEGGASGLALGQNMKRQDLLDQLLQQDIDKKNGLNGIISTGNPIANALRQGA
jgi:hypothetical protein